ncbi:alpha/beta fold hydrolase [Haloarcula amylovorans]|uniref:alpha/beta fold hydrolase n=1 Tax=Haloarcula amylovorans TaxID=2562280 RepID=UPI001075D49E|nr:alpha/beta hydrolase [Halomicroarcula amylolytica]
MAVTQCNGAALYYEDYGEGQPILFLHGAWAGLRYFEPQLTALSDKYRTVALDFRGHGRSEKTEHGHTVRQYASDVHEFLLHLDLDDVIMVGWSMGAGVAWEFVDQFGTERVRGLVNVDSEPSPFQQEDYEFGRMGLEELSGVFVDIQTDHLSLTERQNELLLKDPSAEELKKMMFDEASHTPPPIKTAIFADVLREPPDVLPDIDVPMLVCAGADEKWRSVASVKYVAEVVPDSSFELFEESGHCITIEEPERFNQVLSDFVDSL